MIKVAFLINFNHLKWLGGTNVIKNLIYCINKFSSKKIKPVLIVRDNLTKKDLKEFKNIKIIKTNFFNQSLLEKIYNKLKIIFFGKSKYYDNFFIKNKINVLSHSNVLAYSFFLGKKSSIKSLPWIADFQYIHYPENFSKKSNFIRNLNIKFCASHSTKILVSSYDAQKDLRLVSEKAYKKSKVSQFYFKSPEKKEILSILNLTKRLKIKPKFFFLPNQYWAHKNHIIILKSLLLLKKNNNIKDLLIISTGHKEDHRNKYYFEKTMKEIIKNDLEQNYRYLGVVSYQEVLSLIYHSVALINPSKFEGRHSSVEQARSMGKKIILSDINIHREQNPPRSFFFNPNNSEELCTIINKLWKSHNTKKEKKFINLGIKKNKKDLLKYYKSYEKIVTKII